MGLTSALFSFSFNRPLQSLSISTKVLMFSSFSSRELPWGDLSSTGVKGLPGFGELSLQKSFFSSLTSSQPYLRECRKGK